MGRSLSKERARVLKGMGYRRAEHGESMHHWIRYRYGTINAPGTAARIAPIEKGSWLAVCRDLTWPPTQDRRQTFPDPITAAIWIELELELSQEAGV